MASATVSLASMEWIALYGHVLPDLLGSISLQPLIQRMASTQSAPIWATAIEKRASVYVELVLGAQLATGCSVRRVDYRRETLWKTKSSLAVEMDVA